MLINTQIKYSTQFRNFRIYESRVEMKEHRISKLVYLDENLEPLDNNDHNYDNVSYILKYFYADFDSLRGTSDSLELNPDNLVFYLFIPVEPMNGQIRVINTKIKDKPNIMCHLRELSYSNIRSVYDLLTSRMS